MRSRPLTHKKISLYLIEEDSIMKRFNFISMFLIIRVIAVHAQVVNVAFEEWPLYEYTKDNIVTGIDVDTLKEVTKMTGIEFKFTSLPWARALNAVETGKTDAIFHYQKMLIEKK